MKFVRAIAGLVLAGTLVVSASGCATTKVDAATATAIIDVRTPAEFASGHLEGAINMDVEGGEFTSQVATLDKTGTYLLYCHSGRRAGIAMDQMASMGFPGVTNLGGLEDAAAVTSLPIVQ
jgi:rhodanese-related sulfurtransferase